MEPRLIGYFPGYALTRAPGTRPFEEICSANRGHFRWPENWTHQQRHNLLMLFDSERIAWTVLQDEVVVVLERDEALDPPWEVGIFRLPCTEFNLFAYKVWPICYDAGQPRELRLVLPKVAPVPEGYQQLGYDVVSWSGRSYFGCCPLYCNEEASRQPVNRYCLLDKLEPALDLARFYSEGNWELGPHYCGCRDPGPYCVVEVWRRAQPFADPERFHSPFQWSPDLLHELVAHKLGHVFEPILTP